VAVNPRYTRVTLADVANRAGFSRSTASLVFQGSTLVADSTREAVLAAAGQLGYVYNRRAASLRTQRTLTIGLIIGALSNPFFADLTEAVEDELAPLGYTVLLGNTLEDVERQASLITTLCEYRVDGLLIVPAVGSDASFVGPMSSLGVPHVLVTRRVAGVTAPYVGSDDYHAGERAAAHLAAHGCRSVAYFGGREGVYVRSERFRGVRAASLAAGMTLTDRWSASLKTSSTAGYDAATALLRDGPPPDGVVCHSDAIAFGFMRAVRDAGLTVGEDVRVIGFDDVEMARHWSPSLTSMSVNAGDLGRAAARLLAQHIDGVEGLQDVILQPELIVRESCGSEA
jgi:LacI family transcriptional regulator